MVRQFYVPTLNVATSYDRAVGYFTATSLAIVSRGLKSFASRGCRIRLIASPQLFEEDIAQIDRGYEIRTVLEQAAVRALSTENERLLDGLSVMGRLIATGQLDIKLAFVESEHGIGIYHEKIGLLRDADGNQIAFTGSANETHGGLVSNFETIEVFRSWHPGEGDRAERIARDFEDLWSDKTSRLRIVAFPEVAAEALVKLARERPEAHFPESELEADDSATPGNDGLLRIPPSLVVRDYQKQAIGDWFRADGVGILQMATGTGKTKTAMCAASQLSQLLNRRQLRLCTVIVAPYQHLVDQWSDEVRTFGVEPIAAYESSATWTGRLHNLVTALNLGAVKGGVVVTTNATMAGNKLREQLANLQVPLLMIGDEVHNLGSKRLADSLPTGAAYRLGLSATPDRFMDEEGNLRLADYFGPVVFALDLRAAIAIGALCNYYYFPRLVQLEEDEANHYAIITAQIAAMIAAGSNLENAEDDAALGALLRRRSGILGHARAKLPLFQRDLRTRLDAWYQLVYCAEGSRPEEHAPDGDNQVRQVLELVGRQEGLTVNTYVSDTPREERRRLLRRFGSGDDLRVLVSMRCLDEGVDIPDARVGYLLASSTNPRQFVQRRGRLLRPAPGKEHAEIFDYIVVPPDGSSQAPEVERALVRRELQRAAEFANTSMNPGEAHEALRPVKQRFGLMDL